ncbi:ubiquitin-specific protease [Ancistrocladus abbreviatus]
MLIVVDLGFRFAALVVCCVFFPVVIGFVIRRKWRLAAARTEEIKRLLALASEEAALAELEAKTIRYGGVQVSSQLADQECPVCFTPAKKRCKRCKAVWYCSGKCQIIHWRQGHKDDCHPPLASLSGAGSSFPLNAVEKEYFADDAARLRTGGVLFVKPSQSTYKGSESDNCNLSHEELSGEEDGDEADEIRRSVASKACGISASSGYCEPSPADKPCSDGSVPEVDGLHDLDTPDRQHSDSTSDKLETCFNVKNMKQAKLLPQELTTMVEPIDNLCSSTDLKGDKRCRTSSSGLSIGLSEGSSSAGLSSSSDFWDGSLNSCKVRKHDPMDSVNSNYDRAGNGDLVDSRSSLHFAFNLSGNLAPDLHPQGLEISDDNYSGASGMSMLTDESRLLEKDRRIASGDCSSTLFIPKWANSMDNDGKDEAFAIKSGLLSSSASYVHSSGSGNHSVAADASKAGGFPSSGLERRRDMNSAHTGGIVQSSAPEVIGSHGTYGYPSSAGNRRHSSSMVKPVKADSLPDRVATFEQVSSVPQNGVVGQKGSMGIVVDQLRASKLLKDYPFMAGSDDVGKLSEKSLFPYELFVKLYNWKEVELLPCGLINCGNSCYANVVLQCLAFTPPLTSYLLQGLHSKACVRKEWCFTCEFERLILEAKKGDSLLSPIGILSYIKKIGSHLANGREEDAHEFLRYAIDTMQSICLQEAGVGKSSTLEEETTLVGLTFGGYLRSKITCKRCRGKSERYERMMDLTVEIEGDIGTLEEALQKFTGSESLDGDNKYQCSRCRSYEKAKKKLSVLEAPNILTIALKRFQSDGYGKLNKSIDFPEILNLAPYMRGASVESPVYRLYGVVVHLNAMNSTVSGHYVCYVRNAQNKWFEIDDSRVKAVEVERVLEKGAYMLFYSRCSARAPRTIRNSLISRGQIMMKHSEGDPSWVSGKDTCSRSVDRSAHSASSTSMHRDETRFSRIPNAVEMDSLSDSSSIFSHSDEVSSTTDSTRESTSIDDISDSLFGDFGYCWSSNWRNSSDSDTSSSSSSSSHHTRRASLSKSETTSAQSYKIHPMMNSDHRASLPVETYRPYYLSEGNGGTFLHSDSSKPSRKLVNSSSNRETDSERLGRPNLMDNVKSDVYQRRSLTSRTRAD